MNKCPQDGGFVGECGCTHPNHRHSALVNGIVAAGEPRLMEVADVDAALAEGFFVDGAGGARVGFGKRLKDHLDAHDAKDAEGRKRRLLFAVDAVRNPDVVETGHRGFPGRTAYLKRFTDFGVLAISEKGGRNIEYMFDIVPKRSQKKGLPPAGSPSMAP